MKHLKIFEKYNEINKLTLYHGTSKCNAENMLKNGWQPRQHGIGGNMGDPKYLYLTSDPEDAMWFAEEKGDNTVIKIVDIPLEYLKPDPEDESGFSMNQLLDRMKNTTSPSKFALTKPLSFVHFTLNF